MRLNRSLLGAAFVIWPSILCAQSYTGTISGSIKDASGGLIPRATITITNQQTDRQESLATDLDGRYTSLPLPPGEYRGEAGLQGVPRAAPTNGKGEINTPGVVGVTLGGGGVTESVGVGGHAPLVES